MVWDPAATKTITTATSVSKVGYNVFEGRTVQGLPVVTVANGGWPGCAATCAPCAAPARYLERPPFAPMFDALGRRAAQPRAERRGAHA